MNMMNGKFRYEGINEEWVATGRGFLSEGHTDEFGSVFWTVEAATTEKGEDITAEFYVKDCYKTVTLDFHYKNDEEFFERLEKIDVLRRHLEDFKACLITARGQGKSLYQKKTKEGHYGQPYIEDDEVSL